MKQISYWANDHKSAARAVLAVLHPLLFAGTVYVAVLLDQLNIHLHYTFALAAVILSVISVLLYPRINQAKTLFATSYSIKKGCELTLLWSTLTCIFFIFNKESRVNSLNTYQSLNSSFTTYKEAEKKTSKPSHSPTKKEVKKQFKQLIKELKTNKSSTGGKAWPIFLIIFGGLALTVLLGGLSCSLSCSGNEALATIVFLGGLAAIIFLMVIAIRKIKGEQQREEKEQKQVP